MIKKKVIKGVILLGGIVVATTFLSQIFIMVYFNEKYYRVPNLTGLQFEQAKDVISSSDLKIKKVGEENSPFPLGEIFLQEPESGTIVKKGRNIKIWTSLGNALVSIPNLVGMNFLEAKSLAEQAGLIIDRKVVIKTAGRYNEVLATDPASDGLLLKGEKISFLVNGGGEAVEVKMPDIIGLTFEDAVEKLRGKNLSVGNVKYVKIENIEKNVVVDSDVKPKEGVTAGSTIDLTINSY